jgi:hypothetical protein
MRGARVTRAFSRTSEAASLFAPRQRSITFRNEERNIMPETIPPMTADELEQDLKNLAFAGYLYVGKDTDPGWENAQMAFGLIPRLRIYLVKDATQISKWTGPNQPAGLVFGWDDQVAKFLTQAEADDLKTVVKAISNAMKP